MSLATGAWFPELPPATTTVTVSVAVPPCGSVTVSFTSYVPSASNACETLSPEASLAAPPLSKSQV